MRSTGRSEVTERGQEESLDGGVYSPIAYGAAGEPPGSAFRRTLAKVSSRFVVYFFRAPKSLITILALLMMAGVGLTDCWTGPQVALSLFYLLPVIFASGFAGKERGSLVASLSAVLWFVVEYWLGSAISLTAALWNATTRFCILLFVALLISHIRALHKNMEQIIRRRSDELAQEISLRLAMEKEMGLLSQREQQRIAYELHDGLGQELGALAFQAKLLAARFAPEDKASTIEAEKLVTLLNQAIGRTRALSRLLDPVGSESGGVRNSLSQLVDYSGKAYAIGCTLEASNELPTISKEAELHLYRIAQEAIRNAVEHGRASEVTVTLAMKDDRLQLSVDDNGSGMGSIVAETDPVRGMGLRIMRHRAASLGAELRIESSPGNGWHIICSVPLGNVSQTKS